jgi:hypothetical protein
LNRSFAGTAATYEVWDVKFQRRFDLPRDALNVEIDLNFDAEKHYFKDSKLRAALD